jgi:hypothetical protein
MTLWRAAESDGDWAVTTDKWAAIAADMMDICVEGGGGVERSDGK